MKKRIHIDELRPGMYLVGIGKPELETIFFITKRWIKREKEIILLKQYGISEVVIDPTRVKGKKKPRSQVPQDAPNISVVVGSVTGESPEGEKKPQSKVPQDTHNISVVVGSLTDEMPEDEKEPQSQVPQDTPNISVVVGSLTDELPEGEKEPQSQVPQDTPNISVVVGSVPDELPEGKKKPQSRAPQDKPNISIAVGSLTDELPMARTVRYVALETVQTLFQEIEKGGTIHSEPVQETVSGILNSLLRCREASLMLLHMREFDNDLFNHAVNVSVISLVVGKDHGMDEQELTTLGMGALLHDVGWMCFPRELLNRQGVITDQERKLIEEHPNAGVAILTRSGDITEEVLRIVAAHHERLDGTGYPAALKGEDISTLSRVVAITNIFDSMISGRRGKSVIPPTQVLQHLYRLGASGKLDDSWVDQTIRSLGVYPVGSLVELDTGERAIIMAVNPEKTLRPVMKLIQDEEQQFLPEPPVVDISVPAPGEPTRLIRRALDPAKEGISLAQYLG